jgi:hypothetical protein
MHHEIYFNSIYLIFFMFVFFSINLMKAKKKV